MPAVQTSVPGKKVLSQTCEKNTNHVQNLKQSLQLHRAAHTQLCCYLIICKNKMSHIAALILNLLEACFLMQQLNA